MPDPHTEDGHSHLDMFNLDVLRRGFSRLGAVAAIPGEPIAFDDVMLRRFANTFLEEIARPDEIDRGGDFRFDLDGRSNTEVDKPSDASNSFCDGWVYLASVNPDDLSPLPPSNIAQSAANNRSFPVCTLPGLLNSAQSAVSDDQQSRGAMATKQFAPALVNVPNVLGMQQRKQ